MRKSANRGISQGRADADGQDPQCRGGRHLRGEACERVEDRRQPALIGAAGLRHHQPVGLALEQRDAEPLLQKMHHPADRGRRDVELEPCGGKTAAARRGLERSDAVEKQKSSHLGLLTSLGLYPQEN
jgi:hypothetical protein